MFGGIYEGFYREDPFAVTVALFKFVLTSACEVLLTFLADGLFVTRHALRTRAAVGAAALVAGQLALLASQAPMWALAHWLQPVLHVVLLAFWAAALVAATKTTWR